MHAQKHSGAWELDRDYRKRIEWELANGEDYSNPAFMFSTTNTCLLLAIADGMIDPVQLAREQLANRGLDANGEWVGHELAREIHLDTPCADGHTGSNQEDER